MRLVHWHIEQDITCFLSFNWRAFWVGGKLQHPDNGTGRRHAEFGLGPLSLTVGWRKSDG